jgi:hypothetical protein
MDESEAKKYDPIKLLDTAALPEDSITIVIRCGDRTYSRGVFLEDTQEKTAKLVSVLMQQVADTVDAKGLKAGGSLYDPTNR